MRTPARDPEMRDKSLERIDHALGEAARSALEEAQALWPQLSRPAVIDKLLIWGVWFAKRQADRPPELFGRNRKRWKA